MSIMNETIAAPKGARELARRLKDKIVSGELRPGDRLPTFAKLQETYGMASDTVTRAYDRLQEEGLVRRVRGSGVYVTESENHGQSPVIGCWGSGFAGTTSYWMECLNGVRTGAAALDADLMLMPDLPPDQSWDKVDGVVVAPPSVETVPEPLRGKPRVALMYDAPDLSSVVADDFGGTRMATGRLIELGHRSIAAFYIDTDNPFVERRLAGYKTALRAAGIRPRPEWSRRIAGDFKTKSFTAVARQRMTEWIKDDWSEIAPTAVVAHNDEVAIGVVHALQQEGVAVPEEVSVIGFDGTEAAGMCYPPLTTVKVPLRDIGQCCLEVLLRKIEDQPGAERTETTVLPTELIEGQTMASPPGTG